jgi:hypothetical protein
MGELETEQERGSEEMACAAWRKERIEVKSFQGIGDLFRV